MHHRYESAIDLFKVYKRIFLFEATVLAINLFTFKLIMRDFVLIKNFRR